LLDQAIRAAVQIHLCVPCVQGAFDISVGCDKRLDRPSHFATHLVDQRCVGWVRGRDLQPAGVHAQWNQAPRSVPFLVWPAIGRLAG